MSDAAPAIAGSRNDQEIVETYWKRHHQWSALGDHLKRRITFWRTMVLILGSAGALLQTGATTVDLGVVGTPASVLGAVMLVFVPFITKYFLTQEQVRQWLRARSMSEGLKSLIFRFQARAAPFAGDDRASKLAAACSQAETWVEALAVELSSLEETGTPPPGPLDHDAYVAQRVVDQIDGYYRKHARINADRAQQFRGLELMAAGVAAVIGAVATTLRLMPASGASGGIGAWVAVLTTIGGAIAAHAAASRYDLQARVYFATARQLEDLKSTWLAAGKPGDPTGWSTFVSACEEAISAENRGWMAKLDPEESSKDAEPIAAAPAQPT